MHKEYQHRLNAASGHEQLNRLLDDLNHAIADNPDCIKLLGVRAELWIRLDAKGKALNDLLMMQKSLPEDRELETRINMLQGILRYTNSDIYANTNTHMDPWLE